MPDDLNSQIVELMKAQQFSAALPLLCQAIKERPFDWSNYYMAGQCARFLEDFDAAVSFLQRAVSLEPDEPALLLAYGIALQLTNNFSEAVNVLRRAIKVNPDYELAFNSLALSLEKLGENASALETYESGLQALSRRIVRGLRNSRSNRIFKHEEMACNLWFEYATYGALYLCSLDQAIQGFAFPSASLALEEERTERSGGLYWADRNESDSKLVRLFLPNYFNTFREALRVDRAYATLTDNKGYLLEQIGEIDDARRCFDEARYFLTPL